MKNVSVVISVYLPYSPTVPAVINSLRTSKEITFKEEVPCFCFLFCFFPVCVSMGVCVCCCCCWGGGGERGVTQDSYTRVEKRTKERELIRKQTICEWLHSILVVLVMFVEKYFFTSKLSTSGRSRSVPVKKKRCVRVCVCVCVGGGGGGLN